jgi:hypothetical protein
MNTCGVLTPSGEYIGESWLPVVNFLVYGMVCTEIILHFFYILELFVFVIDFPAKYTRELLRITKIRHFSNINHMSLVGKVTYCQFLE